MHMASNNNDVKAQLGEENIAMPNSQSPSTSGRDEPYPEKTTGSETGEPVRKIYNTWMDPERSELFERGMQQIIFGGNGDAPAK